MTAKEITQKLKEDGITMESFVQEDNYPEWIGEVKYVDSTWNLQTKEELENHTYIYFLPKFNIHVRAMGTKEEDESWEYWEGFEEVTPHQVTTTEYI